MPGLQGRLPANLSSITFGGGSFGNGGGGGSEMGLLMLLAGLKDIVED